MEQGLEDTGNELDIFWATCKISWSRTKPLAADDVDWLLHIHIFEESGNVDLEHLQISFMDAKRINYVD